MYRTIVVPLDGSPVGERAAEIAAGLAERSGTRLELVRVHGMYPSELSDHDAWDTAMRHEEQRYLSSIARRLEREAGITVRTAVLDGLVVEAIAGYAESCPRPLIVMTSHGRTGASRAWLGSVADGVMRRASAAVLMLHASKDEALHSAAVSFKRLILPLDGSEIAEQALPHALAVAEITGAQLLLLRVVVPMHAPPLLPFATPYVPPPDLNAPTVSEMTQHADGYLARLARKVQSEHPSLDVRCEVRVDESPARAIVEVARENECDLAIMATHGRGASRLFMGSVADKVIRGGPPAVMLARAHHD